MYWGENYLDGKIEEIYTQDGKFLSELIQEWINENKSIFGCKRKNVDVKYITNR